ncbi:MAG: geranylgeranylglyceryl/heptaprenylglyceryl phosphate synthase [Actinobacteria bacterium RBG_13_63_9]|nr:MAG: geranylgeranylglyceryl/heptaprenylglyceryl phosphate synthase [Actinobacteria bacterium RBG_13_63_9]
MTDYRQWRTILKLDPARPLSEERLAEACSWRVDAVVVGGSGGYGLGEVLALLTRLRRYPLPLALEVSDLGAVCPGFDLYLVPTVLNSQEVDWVVGHHQAAIKRYGRLMDWQSVVVEGYCILNPEATAARISHARTDLEVDDVVAFARLAEHLLKLPIFYLEYSGTYGSPEVLRAVRGVLDRTLLWYGGGIRTPGQAGEMAVAANAIVIGNAVYEGCSPLE